MRTLVKDISVLLEDYSGLDVIDEAKWTKPAPTPATNLKRGDAVYVPHPDNNHTMLTGTYLRTAVSKYGKEKPGHPHGHLVKLKTPIAGSGTDLHWTPHDKIFDDIEAAWPMSKRVTESNEGVDNITMTVPLFIRCLEWAKEEAKDDVEIHKFVENIIAKDKTLDTDDYEGLLPESVALDEITDARIVKAAAHTINGGKKDLTSVLKWLARMQVRNVTPKENRTGPILHAT